MTNNYTCYHLHSDYSLLDSTTDYKEYIKKAIELEQTAIAFTEHGNIFNWTDKKMECDKNNIKYIHGCEVYLTESLFHNRWDGDSLSFNQYKIRDNLHTVLLAKNYEGVLELNKLISISSDPDHFYYKPRLSFDEFLNISDNIIKISACLASPIARMNKRLAFHNEKISELKNIICKYNIYIDKCQEDVFNQLEDGLEHIETKADLERYQDAVSAIQQEINNISQIYNKYNSVITKYNYYEIQGHNIEEQKEYNKLLYSLSLKNNIPLIVGTDTHAINQYHNECRLIMQKAKMDKVFGDKQSKEGDFSSTEEGLDLSYKNYDELIEYFITQDCLPLEVIIEALENTNIMASSIEEFTIDLSFKYPKMYENDEVEFISRLHTMYQEKITNGIIKEEQIPAFDKNIAEEIKVFKKINMIGFMLSMSEIMCWCRDNNIPVGFGRGSCTGSTIAYILNITDVNPIKWNTVFSRFCNEDRLEIGDIDVDVYKEDRELVYDYIIKRFGQERTSYILAISTVADKGTIDDIGRALKYEIPKVKKIKKEYEDNPEQCKKNYPELFYYFDGILNTRVAQSMHPAGIVVSPITLSDNYGTFNNKGLTILQLDMDCVHECGLVKYDILGLKNVGIIKKTYELLEKKYPLSHEINWDDLSVWESMRQSNVGIFQFEGAFAFKTLKDFKCYTIEDMSLVTAMIRPSGASYRDKLVKHIPNINPSTVIDELLKDNLGYLVYQEDVIKFLTNICGMSGSEADNVRRAIGRKDVERLQKSLPKILEGYCQKSDKPRETSELEALNFIKVIEDASSYMFGFNHSVAYCMIGYICAYLRHYHPYEFLTAFFNCSETEEDFVNGTELARILKINIFEPKFRYSKSEYFFNKEQHSIYKGMKSIKHLSEGCAESLYTLKDNEYKSFTDLLYDIKDLPINKTQVSILIRLDFFSEFGNSRELLAIYEYFIKFKLGKAKQMKKILIKDNTLEDIISRNSISLEAIYKNLNIYSIMLEVEKYIKNMSIDDFSKRDKAVTQLEYLGYINLSQGSNNIEERRKVIILSVRPLKSKKNEVWAYAVQTHSLGSGVNGNFTIYSNIFEQKPLQAYNIIYLNKWYKKNEYWYLNSYEYIE